MSKTQQLVGVLVVLMSHLIVACKVYINWVKCVYIPLSLVRLFASSGMCQTISGDGHTLCSFGNTSFYYKIPTQTVIVNYVQCEVNACTLCTHMIDKSWPESSDCTCKIENRTSCHHISQRRSSSFCPPLNII